MQPDYEKPCIKRPDFTKENMPTYDYRNMENAGQYRGVGEAGKTGLFSGQGGSIETMPPKPRYKKVRRDHEG